MEADEVIRRQLGKAYEVEIENSNGEKDKVKLSPLRIKHFQKLYGLLGVMKDYDEENPFRFIENLDEPVIETIKDLAVSSLRPNYPDVPEESLVELAFRNIFVFLPALLENNISMGSKDIEKIKRAQTMQRLKNNAVQNTGNTGPEKEQ